MTKRIGPELRIANTAVALAFAVIWVASDTTRAAAQCPVAGDGGQLEILD